MTSQTAPLARANGDSAGITAASPAAPVTVPLAQLAGHPRNPRRDLGDLTEMTASIAQHGIFEPLVVLTAAAYTAAADTDGDPERPVPGYSHVIVMGHRRAAAARAAGLAEAPVVVRDDLAGASALAAMIAENLHREGLDPLAEAEAMAELARRGWRQRRIAAEIGCSQAHVSKRMALLQLPDAARAALAAGELSVADALELHKLTGAGDSDVTDAVIDQAVKQIQAGHGSTAYAISQAKSEVRRARAEHQTRADLAARGIEIITAAKRDRLGWPRVWNENTTVHEKAGCLAAVIGYHGDPEYVCANPAAHPDGELSPYARQQARAADDDREARKAARARDAACTAIAAAPLPEPAELARTLAATLLGGTSHSETIRLACRWLRDAGIAPPGADHYRWRDQLAAAGDHKTLQRYAHAYALAAAELTTRSRWGSWGERHIAHLEQLARQAGYQPGAWEQARLAEARAAIAARGTLACPDCGCTAVGPSGCDVRYDRDTGKPVQQCSWDCPRHRADSQARAGTFGTFTADSGDEPGTDELYDALEDLFIATDPTTAAGSRLPGGLAGALEDTRITFAGLYQDLAGDQPPGEVITAARALRAAALPHHAAWTPELRDALQALSARTHDEETPGD